MAYTIYGTKWELTNRKLTIEPNSWRVSYTPYVTATGEGYCVMVECYLYGDPAFNARVELPVETLSQAQQISTALQLGQTPLILTKYQTTRDYSSNRTIVCAYQDGFEVHLPERTRFSMLATDL